MCVVKSEMRDTECEKLGRSIKKINRPTPLFSQQEYDDRFIYSSMDSGNSSMYIQRKVNSKTRYSIVQPKLASVNLS